MKLTIKYQIQNAVTVDAAGQIYVEFELIMLMIMNYMNKMEYEMIFFVNFPGEGGLIFKC